MAKPRLAGSESLFDSLRSPPIPASRPQICPKSARHPGHTLLWGRTSGFQSRFRSTTRNSPEIRMLASKVRDFVPFSADFASKHDPACQSGVAERNRRSKGVGRGESAPKKSVRGIFRGETAGPGRSGSPVAAWVTQRGAQRLELRRLMRSQTVFPAIPPTWDRLAAAAVQVSRGRMGRPPWQGPSMRGAKGSRRYIEQAVAIQVHTLIYGRKSLLTADNSTDFPPSLFRFDTSGV
jgi:hypothetical protein